MKFHHLVTALVTLSIISFYSCDNDNLDLKGKKIFRYNQVTPISSLDPAFARTQANTWAIDHLYNGLVQLDDSMNVRPCIAQSWEISSDGLTYVFHLRNDIFFHDDTCFKDKKGRQLVSKDIVYSFNRIIDDAVASPGSWVFKDKVDSLQAFSAPNDSTFILKLQSAFRPMLSILTMQYCFIVPHEAIDYYGKDFRSHPVGTGAFRFKKWIENQGLFLFKNNHYFEHDNNGVALPYIDGIRVSFMSDRKTAYLEMMKGKLDFMSGIESSIVNELLTPEGELQPKVIDKIQLLNAPYLNTEYFGICLADSLKNPLKNKKIRQALNYGFDRQQMLITLRNNMGMPATSGFTPYGLPSFDANAVRGYNYDPDKARNLLAEAGFPNGTNLPPIKLLTNKDYLDICTFICRQYEDLGIKAKVEVMESATLREMMSKSEAPFFRASWIADYPDAESFFTVFYSKNPAPPNYTRFHNKQFDYLYEQSLQENNDEKRYQLYQSMDKILIEEAPVVFSFYDESSRFASKRIKGLSNHALNILVLKNVKIE